MYVAATKPTRSPTTPPPRAITQVSRLHLFFDHEILDLSLDIPALTVFSGGNLVSEHELETVANVLDLFAASTTSRIGIAFPHETVNKADLFKFARRIEGVQERPPIQGPYGLIGDDHEPAGLDALVSQQLLGYLVQQPAPDVHSAVADHRDDLPRWLFPSARELIELALLGGHRSHRRGLTRRREERGGGQRQPKGPKAWPPKLTYRFGRHWARAAWVETA